MMRSPHAPSIPRSRRTQVVVAALLVVGAGGRAAADPVARVDPPLADFGECRTPRAVYETDGQMKQNIDKARTGKLADQLRELWPDAVQRARIGKERKQNRRPHDGSG